MVKKITIEQMEAANKVIISRMDGNNVIYNIENGIVYSVEFPDTNFTLENFVETLNFILNVSPAIVEDIQFQRVIASWGISNTASLNVWEMNNDEAMLVGINNNIPEWCEIVYIEDEETEEQEENDMIAVIDFHGTYWRLDQCMRTNY